MPIWLNLTFFCWTTFRRTHVIKLRFLIDINSANLSLVARYRLLNPRNAAKMSYSSHLKTNTRSTQPQTVQATRRRNTGNFPSSPDTVNTFRTHANSWSNFNKQVSQISSRFVAQSFSSGGFYLYHDYKVSSYDYFSRSALNRSALNESTVITFVCNMRLFKIW